MPFPYKTGGIGRGSHFRYWSRPYGEDVIRRRYQNHSTVQTELHDEKHQPDIKNGRNIGMLLDEFTEEACRGLERGDEDIPVGTTLRGFGYEVVEMGRKRLFGEMMEKMKG